MPESRIIGNVDFSFRRGSSTALYRTSIQNGSFNLCTDTGDLYIDIDDRRIAVKDIITMDREVDILALINPYDRIYYANDTYNLWRYDRTSYSWKQVAGEHVRFAEKAESDANGHNFESYYQNKADASTQYQLIDAQFEALERVIDHIHSFEITIVDSFEDLPPIGSANTIYFVPRENADLDTIYDEYVWIEEESYYEKIGISSADLTNYYTKSEISTVLEGYYKKTDVYNKSEMNTFLNTKSSTAHTHNNFIFATETTDGAPGMVPAPSKEQHQYVLTAHGWDIGSGSVAYATNAGTADYSTNSGTALYSNKSGTALYSNKSGTATHASTADYSFESGSAGYANNAGTATEATHASTADYATNTGTALYSNKSGTATHASTADYATNAGSVSWANVSNKTNFTAPTASAAGKAGLVPAPAKNTMNYVLTASGWKNNASVAYATNAGSVDWNNVSNKANFTAPTASAAGTAGLVPAPAAGQQNYVLTGSGWKNNASVAYATSANRADTASYITWANVANKPSTFTAPTASEFGTSGFVPAPAANTMNYVLTASGWSNGASVAYATNAGTASKDSAGQQINTTYIKNASVSGRTVTFTRGDSSTFSITTQDNNTTYGAMTAATTAVDGAAGLVPKPTKTNYAYFLTGHGWDTNVGTAAYATNAGTAVRATNADTATYANSAGGVAWNNISNKPSTFTAGAGTATYDSAGNNINTTYIKSASVSGRTVTFTKGNGGTFSITTQDNNTTYAAMTAATTAADGAAGLVPKPTSANYNYVLTGHGWAEKAPKAINADTATYATSAGAVAWGNVSGKPSTYAPGPHSHAYVSTASYNNSNRRLTFTLNEGSDTSTFYITTKDTTYTAMTPATTGADGAAGLVPKPTAAQYDYVLTGHGWAVNDGTFTYAKNSGTALVAGHANTADSATNADTATYATNAGTSAYSTNTAPHSHAYVSTATYDNSTRKLTFTRGDNSTFSIITKDSTYSNMINATSSTAGTAGLVPAPAAGQQNYVLTGSGWKNNASVAYATSANRADTASYITWANVANKPIFTSPTETQAGESGLVPKPLAGQQDYILTGSGWSPAATAAYATKSGDANYATNAGEANYANTAGSVNWNSVTNKSNFTAPTASAAGTAGLVPAPAKNTMNYVLTASGWVEKASKASTADYASSAGSVDWDNVSNKAVFSRSAPGLVPTAPSNTGMVLLAGGWANGVGYSATAGTADYSLESNFSVWAQNTTYFGGSGTTENSVLDDTLIDMGDEG